MEKDKGGYFAGGVFFWMVVVHFTEVEVEVEEEEGTHFVKKSVNFGLFERVSSVSTFLLTPTLSESNIAPKALIIL